MQSFGSRSLCEITRTFFSVFSDRTLKINSTWLQKDITDNKLVFQLSRETFSEVHDYIIFSVSAPQCQTIDTLFLYFKYHPTEEQSTSIQVSVRLVQVSVFSSYKLFFYIMYYLT